MKKEELIILLILLAIVVVLLRLTGRRKKDTTRAGRLMKKYGHITREKLLSAPEGELVDAVVCRVLAKAEESRRPDPVRTLAELQHGSTVVYTVWAVCKEMARGDFAALRHSATWELADRAAENFRGIGATACGDAWQALMEADDGQTAAAEEAFRRAVSAEQPLGLCEDYIRDHVEEFLDEDASPAPTGETPA